MDELIWFGNTLYPLWFVILFAVAAFIAPFVIWGFARFIRYVLQELN